MTDIFISYKREDEARVAPIVEGLRSAGLSVWWDREIAGAEAWRQSISKQLDAARCVIVVWSEISVGPLGEFVHDEAGRAKRRGVLLPVRIDRVSEPLGFGEIQSLDLVDWRGNPRDLRFKNLVAAARAIVNGKPRPRPMTPGRRARFWAAWVSGLGVAAAVLSFAANLVGLQNPLCKIPGVHAACASWGLGGVPTREEETLWARRVTGDCDGLRTYLARFPEGAYAEEAGRRLQAAVTVETETWVPGEQRLLFAVEKTLDPLANEQAARADALTRAKAYADGTCEGLKIGGLRVKSATVEAQHQHWRCLPRGSGVVCGFDGQVICRFEARRVTQHLVCK
jgi:TIR domain